MYEFIKDKQKDANLSAIGKGLSELKIAIIPINERSRCVFTVQIKEYMNVIRESHRRVCFARLNGRFLCRYKSEERRNH